MNLEEKKNRIKEIEELTTALYTEQYHLREEAKLEETELWYKTGIPAKVEWFLNTDRIGGESIYFKANPRKEVPDEYWTVFDGYHDRVEYNGITFLADDSDAYMYGLADKVLEFVNEFNVIVNMNEIMKIIQELSTKLLGMKKLYTQVKGITFEDINWPES
jgi:hypothetical protein